MPAIKRFLKKLPFIKQFLAFRDVLFANIAVLHESDMQIKEELQDARVGLHDDMYALEMKQKAYIDEKFRELYEKLSAARGQPGTQGKPGTQRQPGMRGKRD